MNIEKIEINGKLYTLRRLKLREWVLLEEAREELKRAAEKGNPKDVIDKLRSFFSAAFCVDTFDDISNLPWKDVASIYIKIRKINQPINNRIPILIYSKEDTPVKWDYKGRAWYFWAHLFAFKYCWDLNYIANLDIDDAIALLQEILVDEQLQREWEWSLSEIAYSYNETTNKFEFRPLERPIWMIAPKLEIQSTKIKKSLLPVGKVLGKDDIT